MSKHINTIPMRISEKTVELNVCAQINQHLRQQILWFGLTQAQEALLGFDVAAKLHGRILLFQFKASNITLNRSGARQFKLVHKQLRDLQNIINGYKRSVYYVFPMIGNTLELQYHNGDFYNSTWTLDVSKLPNPFPSPITQRKPYRIRKSNLHYAYVIPPMVTIHSEPVQANIETLKSIVESNFAGADGLNHLLFKEGNNYDRALRLIEPFRKDFKMGILLPKGLSER